VDEFGQPFAKGEPSNFNLFSSYGNVWHSDAGLGTKLLQSAHLLDYTVPDAAERIAAEQARAAAFNAQYARLDMLAANPFAGAGYGVAKALGASQRTADAVAATAGAASDVVLTGAAVYGQVRSGGIVPNRVPVPGDSDFIGPLEKPTNWDDLTSHPDAHAFSVHGGDVTGEDLIVRARTGIKPNGDAGPIPPLSSAFYSDDLLISTDQAIRDSGGLQNAIARQPGETVVRVEAQDVGDLGSDLGYGYQRIGATGNKLINGTTEGPLLRIDGFRSAQGIYEFNVTTGRWETITVYPAPTPH
jgi:hypothetical protein